MLNCLYDACNIKPSIKINHDINTINYIYSSVIDDCATLEMLYLKLEQLLTNFEYGTIDFSEIESTRAHIIQTEIQRISKVKIFYMTVYKFRMYALYDIILNKALL